jgi:hypothetical protein
MSTKKTKPTKTKPRVGALKTPLSQAADKQRKVLFEPGSAESARASSGDPSTNTLSLHDFETTLRAELQLPVDAHVIGEPVIVTQIHDPDLPRVGLMARCQRGEHTYEVNLADVAFAQTSPGAALTTRYRAWLGLPIASTSSNISLHDAPRPHKVASDDIVIGQPVELIVLACKTNAIRCRLLGTTREITLRTAVSFEIPGSILTVTPKRLWTHARHPYLSGDITATRFDVSVLGLTPLTLRQYGDWDPDNEFWGEESEPMADWVKPIIARGKRPMFELEQVRPGEDPEDFDSDPIVMAAEFRRGGDLDGARDVLMSTLTKDLRCVDAHAHLGNLEFDRRPKQALQHYEFGAAIAALTLGATFDGVLPWGMIDNRPFLRCLHGTGLCAWRLGDSAAATAVFTRMLWLNPSDNQGARFNLAAIEAGRTWEEMESEEA